MIAFGWVTNMLQRGMATWKRMLEVLDTSRRSRIDRRVQPRTADAPDAGRAEPVAAVPSGARSSSAT